MLHNQQAPLHVGERQFRGQERESLSLTLDATLTLAIRRVRRLKHEAIWSATAASVTSLPNDAAGLGQTLNTTAFAMILPFIEQTTLANAYNYSLPSCPAGNSAPNTNPVGGQGSFLAGFGDGLLGGVQAHIRQAQPDPSRYGLFPDRPSRLAIRPPPAILREPPRYLEEHENP